MFLPGLMMVCQYLDIIIIGHRLCRMLGIVSNTALKKKCQHFLINNDFAPKSKNLTQQNKKANIKIIVNPRNRIFDLWHRCLTHTLGLSRRCIDVTSRSNTPCRVKVYFFS